MNFVTTTSAIAGTISDDDFIVEPSLPPPTQGQINKAAEEFPKTDWYICPQYSDRSLVTAGGVGIAHLVTIPVPATSGSPMEYARKIIAQALVKMAEALTAADIEQIAACVQPEYPEQRDYVIRDACKAHVWDMVLSLARHGSTGMPGPRALLHFLGVEVALSEGAPAEDAESCSQEVPPSRSSAMKGGGPVAERDGLHTNPPKDHLLRACKYAKSTGLNLSVKLASTHPLKFELVAAKGYEKRFADFVRGPTKADDPAGVARAMVLRCLIDVVANADIAGLRVWLPSVDPNLLLDPQRRGEVLLAYETELWRRTREVITSSAHLGLAAFPGAAYCDLSAIGM